MKMNLITIKTVLLCVAILAIFSSCSNSKTIEQQYTKLLQDCNSGRVTSHRWFYFTESGFKETDIPHNAPVVDFKPWTEAIRITSSNNCENTSYFTVNKLGILEAPETFGLQKDGIASKTILVKNSGVFSKSTVGDVFFLDDAILVSFFSNKLFSDNEVDSIVLSEDDVVIAQYNESKREIEPLITKKDLAKTNSIDFNDTEIREIFYKDSLLHILLKSSFTAQTDFSSINVLFGIPLNDDTSEIPVQVQNQSVALYRSITTPRDYNRLPQKMKDLLAPIPHDVFYNVEFLGNDNVSIQYQKGVYSEKSINGYIQTFDYCSIALFEDGTFLFAGKLPSQKVLNNGESVGFTLPKLEDGFVYSNMSLSGSTLIVGWEEKAFYKTGRSGFLAIDMEEVLYGN